MAPDFMYEIIRFPCRLPAVILLSIALIGCGWASRSEASFLKRGSDLLAAGDYSRALIEFKNAAKAGPRDAEPYYQIGLTYLYSGDYRSAIDSFRRCLDLNPGHAGARLKTAELMTTSAQPETLGKAAAQLRELLDLSPQNMDATDALAMAEWRLGNRQAAIERLQQALKDFPSDLSPAVMLARMKLSGNDLPGAEEVLRNLAAGAPQSSEAALALGELYLVTGQLSRAEPEILRAIRLKAGNGQALLALAAIQTATNRWDAAEDTYRRISGLPEKQYRPLHALFLLQRGKQEQGIAELRELARQSPADRAARTRLAEALLGTGRTAEAELLLAAALKRNPKDTDALIERAALYLEGGRAAEAQQDLQQVLQFHPDSADAHQSIARAYKMQGQWQNERRELMEALRLRKELLPARLALARNYIKTSEPKAALQVLEEAPGLQRNQLPVVVERNWALLAINDLASLRASLEAGLRGGRDPSLVVQLALLQMSGREYAAARASAEEVLKSDPRDLRAARIMAESYLAQNQPVKALERLTQLAAAAPDSARLQHMLGLWLLGAGNPAGARKQFEAALRADPKFSAADLALADLDRKQDRTDAARMRLGAMIAREPANVEALLLLAEIEKSSGDHAGAIERYRAVLAVDSSNLMALNNLSTELTPGSPDEALGFAQRAFDIAPDNAAVEDTLGWIYYRKGIYSTAAQYLKAAVAKDPNPQRQLHFGLSCIKLGDVRLGRELLQAALRQNPGLRAAAQEWSGH